MRQDQQFLKNQIILFKEYLMEKCGCQQVIPQLILKKRFNRINYNKKILQINSK